MLRKNLFLALSALLAVLGSSLHDGAAAFELFPRPQGQYTVQRGDTLYGIAGYYYTNPALWPFLWNQNPAIRVKDSGGGPQNQPLVPGIKVDLYHSRNQSVIQNQSYTAPTGLPEEVRFMVSKMPFKGIPYDRKYFRFRLSPRPVQLWGYIVSGPEAARNNYLERDLLYIRFRPSKKQAILVGDRFGVYRDRGPLSHPLNPDRPIGWFSEVVGEVEITSTGHELATAIVLDSYVELEKGDKITLFVPKEREIVPTKTHRLLTGTIIQSASRDTFYRESNHLENDIVFIDRGECHGMKEGMLLNIYRTTQPVPDPYFHRELSVPDTYLGEGMILKAFDKNSTVIITRSREEIVPGDVIKSVSD